MSVDLSGTGFIRKVGGTSSVTNSTKVAGVGVYSGDLYINKDSAGVGLFADRVNKTATNVGTKNGSTVTVSEKGFGGFLHETTFTLASTPLTVADATAGGGVKLYDFPEGAVTILGGSFSLTPKTTSTIASTLKSGVTIDVGIGTATAGAAALTTTEDDIVDSATGPASTVINVAAAPIVAVRTTAPVILDGHSSAKSAYLNVGVPTATDIDADATITVSGTVKVQWMFNGDV